MPRPSEFAYDVVLLRHGETVGYAGDLGLTELGERQARDRAVTLAAEIKPGTTVRLPHARSARATATAVSFRAALVDALGVEAGNGIAVGQLYAEPSFDNVRFSLNGEVVDATRAVAERLGLDGELPDWAREIDRFNTGDLATQTAGGPISYWMHNPTLYFEPPQIAAHRTWQGVIAAGADRPERLLVLAAAHSGPMRAFVAACLGQDVGEPRNLEDVRVRVHADGSATVAFREHAVQAEVPKHLPAWFDRRWFEAVGR